MVTRIDGPRVAAKSRTTKQLIVFLHGYGADGNDLIAIAQQWQNVLPDTTFVSPHAPEICALAPQARQWFPLGFPLSEDDPEAHWAGLEKARPVLDAFLDAELKRYGLSDANLLLVGFSQGTMLALHAGLRRPQAPAGILGYSGMLVGPEHLASAPARLVNGQRPPILLIHGSQDDVISAEAMFVAADQLAEAEIPCQWHLSTGIGHGIDGGGLQHGAFFALQSLKIKRPNAAV
ncbi:alpha/beta hydrolase [Beijerinckia indica]|uniref:Phospholipase/Carboxylesterase n=1 Tax=Beijerinckia indica subsp. indica (strain ATCC 9039 / DSM 1715 / NCIMB 8712) TaxID=395963 RepID=B2IE61_BEII9|nr:phospholipase [Beijerinckia indica]ACB94085.1 phospholipase/Carboxylesterase [Beijerinckia indica subsp. indica ATCC 9039]